MILKLLIFIFKMEKKKCKNWDCKNKTRNKDGYCSYYCKQTVIFNNEMKLVEKEIRAEKRKV